MMLQYNSRSFDLELALECFLSCFFSFSSRVIGQTFKALFQSCINLEMKLPMSCLF